MLNTKRRYAEVAVGLAALLALMQTAGCNGNVVGQGDRPPTGGGGVQPPPPPAARTLFALTSNNTLLRFSSNSPGSIAATTSITGLQAGETIRGIDFRPSNGLLYAVGSTSRLYIVDTGTGAATPVAGGQFTPALNGNSFGVDFNPTVDRLRVTGDADQNLRLNPDTSASATPAGDTTLAYAAGDINQGADPNIVASAYTNSFAGASTTTLYNIDSNRDNLVTQNPANNGTLQTVGLLGVDVGPLAGFDIAPDTALGFAAFSVGGATQLYTINLTTGAATAVGAIGSGAVAISGLALAPTTAAPGPLAYGLTENKQLVSFRVNTPGTITSTIAITGVPASEGLLDIDFRPATGQLYALGDDDRLYTIDTATGAATLASTLSSPLTGTRGIDFNPVPDRLRVVSNSDQNVRIDVDTGTVTTDGAIAFGAGDPNNGVDATVVAAAYTNSFPGATTTSLYDIESNRGLLVQQNPPNSGTLLTVGSLGLSVTDTIGFDILAQNGVAYAAISPTGSAASTLYTINLTTGQATPVGAIAAGRLRGLAVRP